MMEPWRGALGALLLIWATAAAAAVETPMFRVFGAADGLPSESIVALAQDRDDTLWIGTADGLVRFDGIGFETFQARPDDPAALPSNSVQALHVDATGRVWVGTEAGGLSVLDIDSGRFRHYRRDAPAPIALDAVWSIASSADGAIWFGGYNGGLYRIAPDGATVEAFVPGGDARHGQASLHILALAVDGDGRLWVGGNAGLQRFDGQRFLHEAGAPTGLVFSIAVDADDGLWIGTRDGLVRRHADGRYAAAEEAAALAEPGVTAIIGDAPGALWIATRTGLHRVRDGVLRAQPLPSPRDPRPVPRGVLDALRDHEGGLWLATVGAGLQYLPPNWQDFAVLRGDAGRDDAMSNLNPLAVAAADDGRLWVAARALDRVDPASGQVERFLTDEHALPNQRLSAVLQGADGRVWLGHRDGLTLFDPATSQRQHFLAADGGADAPPPGPIDLLLADGQGGVWVGIWGGGLEHRAADGRVLARHLPGDGSGLLDGQIEQLALHADGHLWLASGSGLARRDAASGRVVTIDGGPDARVHAFAFEGDRRVWTHRPGLLELWQLDGDRLQRLRRIDGRTPAVESGGLVRDARGDLWLTTRRGLWRYRPDGDRWRHFGVRDGLSSQEFSDRPPLLLADGRIAALALDSVVLLDPRAIADPLPAPLRLHHARVRRDGVVVDLPLADGGLRLQPGDRELQIGARLRSFVDASARRHRFRLDGHDGDWIETGSSDLRVFGTLAPGRYRMHIDAARADGDWSGAPIAFDIDVAAPWWQQPPARAGQAALVLLALFAGWQWQRRRQAARHALELADTERRFALEASEAKSRFLATLGHEIRTPMTGVLGMTELLLRGELAPAAREQVQAVRRSGELMLRLLNDALDLARIEAGRLPLAEQAFDLHALVRDTAAQQRALAEARGLRFEVDIDAALPHGWRGDPQRLQQVLLNLTGNAIKFTEHGFVAVSLRAHGDGFELAVADSGPGLNHAQQERLFQRFEQADGALTALRYGGSGLGLAISQELVAAMGGRIDVDSRVGEGSTFRVRLCLPRAEPVAAAARTPAPAHCHAPRRILLVEDDATVARVVTALLQADGHAVVHVGHGLAALAELGSAGFDIAILDLDLPGIDGLQLAGMVRGHRPGLPLLALTARADAGAEPQARAAGFDGFLRKPVDGATLAAAVDALCRPREPATLAGRATEATREA